MYILIDEYDSPTNSLLEEKLKHSNSKDIDESIEKTSRLICGIISSCGKNNESLEKIILTGITDIL